MSTPLFVTPFLPSSRRLSRPLLRSPTRRPRRPVVPRPAARPLVPSIRSDSSPADSPDELLVRSAMLSDLSSVESLLQSGASARHASSRNNSLMTALMWACSVGDTAIARLLLSAGADPNAANAQQLTPLLYAFEALPSANPRPAPPAGYPGEPGRPAPPQMPVVKRVTGHGTVIKMLLVAGANAKVTNQFGETCIHLAARKGQIDWVDVIASAGVDVDARSSGYEETALHVAAKEGHADVVRDLARLGADLDARNRYGWTPLVWAAACADVETVDALLELGANPNIRTGSHEGVEETTALKEGRKSAKPQEISNILIRGGAIE